MRRPCPAHRRIYGQRIECAGRAHDFVLGIRVADRRIDHQHRSGNENGVDVEMLQTGKAGREVCALGVDRHHVRVDEVQPTVDRRLDALAEPFVLAVEHEILRLDRHGQQTVEEIIARRNGIKHPPGIGFRDG